MIVGADAATDAEHEAAVRRAELAMVDEHLGRRCRTREVQEAAEEDGLGPVAADRETQRTTDENGTENLDRTAERDDPSQASKLPERHLETGGKEQHDDADLGELSHGVLVMHHADAVVQPKERGACGLVLPAGHKAGFGHGRPVHDL